MTRAAVVATIVASILSSPSLSHAASDAEISSLGDKMSSAFRCSTYAQLSQDQKEQQRLFQIGLKAGRDFVEGLKSRDDPTSELLTLMYGPAVCCKPNVSDEGGWSCPSVSGP